MDVLAACRDAALRSLRANRVETGSRTVLLCGSGIYRHVHVRDFALGLGGALIAGEEAAARGTLEVLLSFQRPDGLIPRAVAPWPPYLMVVADSFGWRVPFEEPLRPNYTSEMFVRNIDCNAFLVWAALRYARARQDAAFVRRHWPGLLRAMAWYEPRTQEGLIRQGPFSDWQDNVARRGRVFFTQVVYWNALKAMEELALQAAPGQAPDWAERAESFRVRASRFFWNETMGAFRNAEGIGGMESGANLLAAAWGFATPEQVERIFAAFEACGARRKLGLKATVPDYPWYWKAPQAFIADNLDYHDRQVWSWQTALEAMAWMRLKRSDRARAALLPMAEVIAREGVIGEVYEDDGQVSRRLFKSECPFTWGAGMWLEALEEAAPHARRN